MRSYIHGRKKRLAAAIGAALLSGVFSIMPRAEAHPVLDVKDAAVSISGTSDMSITSSATNNLIKWVDFSIGSGESVTFDAKNYLNYVTGSARSDILGTLTGGGSIYLVNPNGILIHEGATVNVGNLHLSTRTLTDSQFNEFKAGNNPLTGGTIGGDVINMGTLNATNISVEGKNITFKNTADVKNAAGTAVNTNVTLTASGGEIHIGSATGDPAEDVNETQYKGVTLSKPSGWTMNKNADEAMYMLVRNKYELQNMQNNLAGNYMLAGDIDMSGVNFTPVGYSVLNHETGDEEDTYAFKGRFDGLGYAVKNLSVNFNYEVSEEPWADNKSGIGLFGRNKGTVENVKLSGGSIESTQGRIGIIGINAGTVRNVFNDGVTVKGGEYTVGGIVGDNSTGTIKNVWNKGTVSGSSTVGGIAGKNHDGASIENAWNNGSVSGSGCYVGGIVGDNHSGIVQNVYNTGAVQSGSYAVGGIVGVNQGSSTGTIVEYAYNTGTVTSSNSNKVGGIVGSNYVKIMNAYSKEGTAADVCGENVFDGTAVDVAMKSATDMTAAATFTGFDFSEGGAWRIYEDKTMPLLTAFMKRADHDTGKTKVYDGTHDVGEEYAASNYNAGAQAQIGGVNYVYDYTKVTPMDLTISFGSKTYDGTTDVKNAGTLSGVIAGDTLTVSTASATYDNKNVGTGKTVNYTGLTLGGEKAKNYTIAASGTGTGDITAKALTVSFAPTTKVYDGTTTAPLGAATLNGVIAADKTKVSVTANAAYEDENAGTDKQVNYSNIALTGAEAENYQLPVTSWVNNFGTITRKALLLVATPQTITEGEATPTTWSGTVTGFVAGEKQADGDTLTFALDNPAAAAIGSYKVTGRLSINGGEPAESGDFYSIDGQNYNYTFANAASNATAFTIKMKAVTPEELVANATENQGAAVEYTNVVGSISSGAATAMPTTGGGSPIATPTVTPTTPTSGTQTNGTPTNGTPTQEKTEPNAAATNGTPTQNVTEQPATEQQGKTQPAMEQNGTEQKDEKEEKSQQQPQEKAAATLSYTADGHITIVNEGVNTPVSMKAEAIAAAMSGQAPTTPTEQAATGAQGVQGVEGVEGVETNPAAASAPEAEPASTQDDEEE